MINYIVTVSTIFCLPTLFLWLFLAVFLSMKLKKQKYILILNISNSAPDKFKQRSKFMMESNISWISASSVPFLWFGYLMLRFGWKISREDLTQWRKDIRTAISSNYIIYRIMFISMNISLTFFPILILSVFLK